MIARNAAGGRVSPVGKHSWGLLLLLGGDPLREVEMRAGLSSIRKMCSGYN